MEGKEEDLRAYTEALIDKANEDDEIKQKVKYVRKLTMSHPLYGVEIGATCPDIVTTVIEIPMGSRVKTELDIETGLIRVDRILHSSTIYPANYGFIPETIAGDVNPLDVVVLSNISCPTCCIIHARPIGVMPMKTDGLIDFKIIAVAIGDPEYNIYTDIEQLPPCKLLMINQFFLDYKKLERKTVECNKPLGSEEAKKMIKIYHENYMITYKLVTEMKAGKQEKKAEEEEKKEEQEQLTE